MPMIHEIGLDQILPDPENPRSDELTEIEELAANIKAVGLINPLTVRDCGPIQPAGAIDHSTSVPGYMIVAGHRRYEAVKQLGWKTVPCTLVNVEDPQALELALSENIMRVAMHPVDEHRAFVSLKLQGYSVKKIAKHYGVDDRTVKQRLALGSIIPEFLALWRENKIEWDSVKQIAQMKPGKQRECLVEAQKQLEKRDHVEDWVIDKFVSHKRTYLENQKVRFVTLEDYEKAGGRVDEDLFGDEQWIADTLLLDSLFDRKKMETHEAYIAQGWKSVGWENSTPSMWNTHTQVFDENLEDEEKAKIDLILILNYDGTIREQRWKARPPKEEGEVYNAAYGHTGERPAAYGNAPNYGDGTWDPDVKVKAAVIRRLYELRKESGLPIAVVAKRLIARIETVTIDFSAEIEAQIDEVMEGAAAIQAAIKPVALLAPPTYTVNEDDWENAQVELVDAEDQTLETDYLAAKEGVDFEVEVEVTKPKRGRPRKAA
jgi:ParB/RepB/Spo0J family partition protein